MAYARRFVILKDELGNMGETGLKGHGKFEVKGPRGTVTVNVENSQIQDFYNVDFITKEEVHNLGKIFIDGSGRGKGEYDFTQKKFKIEDIAGLLITKDGNIFLGGYINGENGVIEKYLSTREPRRPKAERVTPKPEAQPEAQPQLELEREEDYEIGEEEYLEEDELVEEPEPEPEPEPEIELEEEIPEEDPVEEIQVEEVEIEDYEEDLEPDYKVIDHMKKINQRDQTTNYILNILRFFPYIDPFKNDLDGYNWWKVDLDEENEYRAFLPYFSYLSGGNNKGSYDEGAVTCSDLMNKYEHYIFGLYNENEEVKYFVYGVPGSFKKEEYPNRGKGGFNTWYEGKDVDGYWIIYIDPMTGKSVIPFNPMIPRE